MTRTAQQREIDATPWADQRRTAGGGEPDLSQDLLHHVESLTALLDESPEPVIAIDRSGRLRYANPACEPLFGTRCRELIGRPIADWAKRHEGADAARAGDGAEADLCALRGSVELCGSDGALRWVTYSAGPLRREDGTGVGAVVFLCDDSERRRQELRSSRRQEELEQTIRTVAHDLRSPLVAVLGFSRLLREDFEAALGERGAHYLERIAEAGRTMETLIRELLDFTRIGHAGERRVLVDPLEVLRHLHGELKPRLDVYGTDLELPDEPPLLHCDRTRLYQLFSNLIGNALDHMGPCSQPRIQVWIAEEGERHHITVRDNGRGIDAREHDRVFEMFHCLPRDDGRKGTGIGLAIVKKIAELHGGRAWVESAPGEGAAFHVLLPRP